MTTQNTIDYIPIDLQQFAVYPKVVEMLDYIVANFEQEYLDISSKYTQTALASTTVVDLVIAELGFSYINDIIATLTNIDTSILLNFLSLLNFMKGTRAGLQIVMTLLGFNVVITEWWETTPPGPEQTFAMTVFFNLSQVADVFATLAKIKIFTQNYVYPLFESFTVVFDFDLASDATGFAGFATQVESSGLIQGTI